MSGWGGVIKTKSTFSPHRLSECGDLCITRVLSIKTNHGFQEVQGWVEPERRETGVLKPRPA